MLWHFSRPNRTVKSDWSGPLIFCKEQFFKLPQYTAHRLTCLDLVCDNCGKDFRSEVDKTNVKGHHVVFQRAKRKWLEYHPQNAVRLRSYSAVLGLLFFRNFLGAIVRLNSGIRTQHNFSVWAIFLFQKLATDSVNCADSGDIKLLVWFPGNSILKFSIIFENAWVAPKCVGVTF